MRGKSNKKSEFDDYSNSYDDAVNRSISFSGLQVDFFTLAKCRRLLFEIDQHFEAASGLQLLDIGCGIGNYHGRLTDAGHRILGVDVSSASLEVARKRNLTVNYKHYDGRVLPVQSGSIDVAFTICVIHHVPPTQWQAFTDEMYRVLRPGGLALIFEHNPLNPLTKRVVSNCIFDADAVLLRNHVAEGLLVKSGFQEVSSRYILASPIGGQTGLAFDKLLGRLPLGAQYVATAAKPI